MRRCGGEGEERMRNRRETGGEGVTSRESVEEAEELDWRDRGEEQREGKKKEGWRGETRRESE